MGEKVAHNHIAFADLSSTQAWREVRPRQNDADLHTCGR